jgi:hypothetical protein
VLTGAVTALCGLAVHRHVWRGLPVDLPWGLLLALTTVFAVVRAAGLLVATAGLVGVAVGWVVAVLLLQPPRDEGDFLLAGDALGYVFLFGGMAAVATAVVTGVNAQGRTGRRGGP